MCVLNTLYQECISGVWTSGWILVHKRTLFYCVQDGTLQEADLRKARCIGEEQLHITSTVLHKQVLTGHELDNWL
jgi:hypothetical protein